MTSTHFSLLDIFFPKLCFNCRVIGSYLCAKCKKKLQYVSSDICPYCEKENGYGLAHGTCRRLYGLDGVLNVFYYDEVFQKVLKAVKFRRIRGGVSALIDSIPEEFWKRLLATSEIFYKNAEILAVPLHRKRLIERGFNQSEDFAHACAIMLQKDVTNIVARNRYTQPQSQLSSATERYLNIQKAFSLNPRKPLPEKVIIIDDVWTTGATIREIAYTLKYAGVERVYAITLSRRAHAQY